MMTTSSMSQNWKKKPFTLRFLGSMAILYMQLAQGTSWGLANGYKGGVLNTP